MYTSFLENSAGILILDIETLRLAIKRNASLKIFQQRTVSSTDQI